MQAAADILDAAILDPITVNITVGYGEYNLNGPDDTPLGLFSSLGGAAASIPVSYAALRVALASTESSATDVQAVAALPATVSLDGQSDFAISGALAKALGAIDPNAAATDGSIGFGIGLSGDALTGAAVDAELNALGLADQPGDLGLFSYTSPGDHYLPGSTTGATSAYFSLDGGVTDLGDYAVGGDGSILLGQLLDPLGLLSPGVALTPLDLTELDAAGYDVTSTPAAAAPDITASVTAPGTQVTVGVNDASVATDHSIPALSLIGSVSVPGGDSLGSFGFSAAGADGGHLELGGVALPDNQVVNVLASQLRDLTYVAGPNPGTDTISVSATDATTGVSSPLAVLTLTTVPATAASIPASDFNVDGLSDLLYQNADGTVAGWLMDSDDAPSSSAVIDTPDPSWHVIGTGDFNGDGKSDILVQNDDGSVGTYTMDGLHSGGLATIADPGPSWHAIGTGDFNGDGTSDILFQNDDGSVATWTMSGGALSSSSVVADPGPAWHAVGTGDFEGNGTSDILLQNDDGSIAVWTMSGGGLSSTSVVADPGPAWHAVGTGDFDGDGKSDILLQNDDSTVAVWTMNGATIASSGIVASPGASWHAIGTGDYNGDGESDIAFQNDDGTIGIWNMNGASLTGTSVAGDPGAAWQLIGQGGLHFIDGTQTSGDLTGTIQADDFVFTSSRQGDHVIDGFDPAHDVVTLNQSAFPDFAAVQAHSTQFQGATLIDLGGGSSLTLANVLPSALSAKNFV